MEDIEFEQEISFNQVRDFFFLNFVEIVCGGRVCVQAKHFRL